MTIIRVHEKNQPYTMILNESIRDDRLTWKARGILVYLLSMPNDWTIYITELEKHAKEGETALRNGMKELESLGYIRKEQLRDEAGKIAGYEYVVYETPQLNNQSETISRKPTCGKATSGKPTCGKSTTTNNELTNNKNTNNDLTNNNNSPMANEHQDMVLAISEVTGMDLKIKSNAGRIYKASKELRDAGYSPNEVREFSKTWINDWRYKADGKPPKLTVLMSEISKTKPVTKVEKGSYEYWKLHQKGQI